MKKLYKYESNSDFKDYILHSENMYKQYAYLQYYEHIWDFKSVIHIEFSKLDFLALFINRECDAEDDIVSFISYKKSERMI